MYLSLVHIFQVQQNCMLTGLWLISGKLITYLQSMVFSLTMRALVEVSKCITNEIFSPFCIEL